MAKLKSSSIKTVTIRERDFLMMHENTMMMEALILAGIKDMPIYKAMERILKDQHIEVHVKPLSSRYSFKPEDTGREQQ